MILIVSLSHSFKKSLLISSSAVAGFVLTEGELFSKDITEDHPLFPLKLSNPTGLFTADSSMPEWAQSHQLLMTAMSAKAMRGYVKIMDGSSKKLTSNVVGK